VAGIELEVCEHKITFRKGGVPVFFRIGLDVGSGVKVRKPHAEHRKTYARSRGGLGKGALAMSVASEGGRNRIMIYGPKSEHRRV
jgi:hypothetical protein